MSSYAPSMHLDTRPATRRPIEAPSTRSGRSAGSPTTPAVRLTRRGRLVIFMAALGVLLATAVAFGASSTATDEPGVPTPSVVVMVDSGESLWQIAARYAEPGGTQALVDRIIEINALDSATVDAGERIRIPVEE